MTKFDGVHNIICTSLHKKNLKISCAYSSQILKNGLYKNQRTFYELNAQTVKSPP